MFLSPQNRKILIAAVAIFIISFSFMVAFLSDQDINKHGETNVLGPQEEVQTEDKSKEEPAAGQKGDKDTEENWFQKIYPKIKDLQDKDGKLLVEKVSYKK